MTGGNLVSAAGVRCLIRLIQSHLETPESMIRPSERIHTLLMYCLSNKPQPHSLTAFYANIYRPRMGCREPFLTGIK